MTTVQNPTTFTTETKIDTSHNVQFRWVIASDPQYPRVNPKEDGSTDDKALSEKLIREQYAAVNRYRDANGGRDAVPVMINGDITEFYHGWQASKMRELIKILGPSVYQGLGNHDYDNNIGDCWNDGCARDGILDMYEHGTKIGADDLHFSMIADNWTNSKTFKGSLAYSKTIGDFTFIQLHNHPAYTRTFKSSEGIWSLDFYIEKSLDWLEQQLQKAKTNKKHVIINVHRPPKDDYPAQDIERFEKLIKNYGVKAIFDGHTHVAQKENDFGDIPVFNSGAGFKKTFLIAEHNTRHAMVYVRRATNNVIESESLGSFKIGEPVTASRVNTSYRIAANEIYATLYQTPINELAWERAEYTFNGKTKTVYFSKSQDPKEEILLNFDGLAPNTRYPVKIVGYTDKKTQATYEGAVTTPGLYMAPDKFCTEALPNWQVNGFVARWARPDNDNWQGKAMFQVGIFTEDNTLIKRIATVNDYTCRIPVTNYHLYKDPKYYIGVYAFNMTSPGDRSVPAKYLAYFLPHAHC